MWSMISDATAQALIAELPERQRRVTSHLEEIVE